MVDDSDEIESEKELVDRVSFTFGVDSARVGFGKKSTQYVLG